jgi:hypothetical protein
MREQGLFDPARLVLVDETAVSTSMARLRGRAEGGERLIAHVLQSDHHLCGWPAPGWHRGAVGDQRCDEWCEFHCLSGTMLTSTGRQSTPQRPRPRSRRRTRAHWTAPRRPRPQPKRPQPGGLRPGRRPGQEGAGQQKGIGIREQAEAAQDQIELVGAFAFLPARLAHAQRRSVRPDRGGSTRCATHFHLPGLPVDVSLDAVWIEAMRHCQAPGRASPVMPPERGAAPHEAVRGSLYLSCNNSQ